MASGAIWDRILDRTMVEHDLHKSKNIMFSQIRLKWSRIGPAWSRTSKHKYSKMFMIATMNTQYLSYRKPLAPSISITAWISPGTAAACTGRGGNLHPLINDGYLKNEKCRLEKYGWAFFPNILKKGSVSQIFGKNTPGAASGGDRRAPPRPEEGVFFQNIWKTYPFFQTIWKEGPSIFF